MSKIDPTDLVKHQIDDAQQWAKCFIDTVSGYPVPDEGLMISWFASAIETAKDKMHNEQIIDMLHSINSKNDRIEELEEIGEKLWAIIDDIDTFGDMAKDNDKLYRSLCEKRQADRWKHGTVIDDTVRLGAAYMT